MFDFIGMGEDGEVRDRRGKGPEAQTQEARLARHRGRPERGTTSVVNAQALLGNMFLFVRNANATGTSSV